MSDSHDGLIESMKALKDSLGKTIKCVNNEEVNEVNKLLKDGVVLLEEVGDENSLILKCKSFCECLSKSVNKKRKEIIEFETMTYSFSGISQDKNFTEIIDKKIENLNQIIVCNNRVVTKIEQLETTVYDNKIKEARSLKTKMYGDSDYESNIIVSSIDLLKEWSNKNTSKVVFDSEDNRDGWDDWIDNVLHGVTNKSCFYFITFDTDKNVFGGYVNEKIENIDQPNDYISDKDSFVFSLRQNGKMVNKKYSIQPDHSDKAFRLEINHKDGKLYQFGDDIIVNQIKNTKSFCKSDGFYGIDDENPPIATKRFTNFETFETKRIMVIEMS